MRKIFCSFILSLTYSTLCIADPGAEKSDKKTVPSAAVFEVVSSGVELACGSTSIFKQCFPTTLANCPQALQARAKACVEKEIAITGNRISQDDLSLISQRALACAINSVIEGKEEAVVDSKECKDFVSQASSQLATAKASGFKPDPVAKQSSAFIAQGILRGLTAARCHPEVVTACFRVSLNECNSIIKKVGESCAEEALKNFDETINRDQGGEIGIQIDKCTGKQFLGQVVQNNPPTPQCLAAMKAHW